MGSKFVFSGTGTRGDLLPMLAMAAEMQRRGHACHVLGNEGVEAVARELGVSYTPVAPAQTNNLTSVEQNFANHVFASYRPIFEHIQGELRRGTDVVLVNAESYAASTVMAERHRLPLCRYTLAPFRMRSFVSPHWPWSDKMRSRLGTAFTRYTLPRLYEQRESHPFIVSSINAHRAALGLPKIGSVRELERLVTHQVCLFPEWYCAPAPDWPAALDCVGFPLPAPRGALPPHVSRWLDERGPVLVFTPGTGVVEVEAFFAAARECCARLGRSGLFLSPHGAAAAADASGAILHVAYADLALVLRRAALLVHHGGIGTTARALESGVPQIISPQAYDQPDNAHRVSRLGAGVMIERARLSGETLTRAASALLDDARARAVLSDLSCRVRAANGIRGFADVLEVRFGRAGRGATASASAKNQPGGGAASRAASPSSLLQGGVS